MILGRGHVTSVSSSFQPQSLSAVSVFTVIYLTDIFKGYPMLTRIPVIMGAVGAEAPTAFESVGASTHGF